MREGECDVCMEHVTVRDAQNGYSPPVGHVETTDKTKPGLTVAADKKEKRGKM